MFRALGVYAVGGAFVGLSTQTTLYMIVAIGLAHMQVDATRRAALRATTATRLAARTTASRARVGGARPQLAG